MAFGLIQFTMLTLRKRTKVNVTPGFLLLAGTLLYLDQSVGVLGWGILAAICHELGHIFFARLFGGRVEVLSLTVTGAELKFSYPKVLSYGMESIIALAGPAANLLTGVSALYFRGQLFAMTSIAIGLFNLLPILPLDGGCILFNLVCELADVSASERIMSVCAGIFIGILFGVGLIAAVHYANIVLLILSGWLLLGTIRKNNNFSPK